MPCVCGALVSLAQHRTGQDRTGQDRTGQDRGQRTEDRGQQDSRTAGGSDSVARGRAGRELWGGELGAAGVGVGGGTGAVHQA
jgi:hypothetical protein